jgi:hypothetical protein
MARRFCAARSPVGIRTVVWSSWLGIVHLRLSLTVPCAQATT